MSSITRTTMKRVPLFVKVARPYCAPLQASSDGMYLKGDVHHADTEVQPVSKTPPIMKQPSRTRKKN